jgi:hypothetical protein
MLALQGRNKRRCPYLFQHREVSISLLSIGSRAQGVVCSPTYLGINTSNKHPMDMDITPPLIKRFTALILKILVTSVSAGVQYFCHPKNKASARLFLSGYHRHPGGHTLNHTTITIDKQRFGSVKLPCSVPDRWSANSGEEQGTKKKPNKPQKAKM